MSLTAIAIFEYLNELPNETRGMARPVSELQVFKAEFFRALAHPVRIRLLEELGPGERSVQALQDALGLAQSFVSQQLAVLRNKSLVGTRKVGTTVWYFVRDPLIHELLQVARRIFDNRLVDTQAMLRELRREGGSRRGTAMRRPPGRS